MGQTGASRRNDAQRNRETILRVADAAFTDGSEVVPLHEIARRAGLGRATVYRHFRDRHALATAVAVQYREALREVVGVDGDGRPFRDVLNWVLSTEASMRPLVALMRELPEQEQRQFAETLIGVLTPPFRRAQAEGHLRRDVEPGDLGLLFSMIDRAEADAVSVGSDRGAAIRRIIAVLLDGLFTAPA